MKFKHNQKLFAGPIIIGVTSVVAAGVLLAQPDANDVGKGENPAGRRGGRGVNRPDFRNMTPEQREEAKAKFSEMRQAHRAEGLRNMLTKAKFTDQALQNAVITFVNAQDKERDDSRKKVRALSQSLQSEGSDKQVAALLSDLRAEIKSSQARREAALRALDGKIGYSKKPRLDAVLTLVGVTGENNGGLGGRGGIGKRGGHGSFDGAGKRGENRPDHGPRPGDLD